MNMKKTYTFLILCMAAIAMNAQSWLNVNNGKGDPADFEVTPELEISWDDEPMDTLGIQYEYTDIDLDNYIYPEADATMNPNLITFTDGEDEVLSLDTLQNIAVLKFAQAVPKLYRGAIVPVVYGEEAYALFILEALVDGNVATIHYRNAAITEIFFNQTLHISSIPEMQTRSTADDYDGKVNQTLKLLSLVESGLKMNLDEVDINFNDTKFDLTFGSFWLFYGKSLNCPFKRLTAVLGGEVTAKGSFSVEPSFSASKGKEWDIKQRLICFHKFFMVGHVPVDLDFDIDICGSLEMKSEISKAIHYAQSIGGTLKVTIGAEYDFETGKMIPLNSLQIIPMEAKPNMSEFRENIHFSFDAAVFPRIKLYFYHFKYAGWGCDIKPLFARLAFNSCKKNGHIFFDTTFSLGSKLKGFMYVWDWDKHANHNLAETPELEKEWWSWKSPNDIKDKTEDVCERLNYGGQSQSQFSVTDLAYEWDQQSFPPAAADEMTIEVEKFGTIPDPTINPEYYKDIKSGSGAPKKTLKTEGSGDGWYSYGLEYYPLDKDGIADVPFNVETPSSENFKLVARILDGNGDVIKEVEHPTRAGIKAYDAVQILTGDGASVTVNLQVRDYGAWIHEVCTHPQFRSDVTFSNGVASGTITVEGHTVTHNSLVGSAHYQARITPVPYLDGSEKRITMAEGYDYSRWAHDKLGISTGGMSFTDTKWRDIPATRVSIPGGGQWTYIGNFVPILEANDVTVTTQSFTIVEE